MSDAEDFSRLSREFRGQDPWRASALLLLLVACIAMAGLWAAWAEVDDVTRADGRVVPSSDVHLVQAPEAGIVMGFGVTEGDVVAEGALLAELDGTVAAAQVDELRVTPEGWRDCTHYCTDAQVYREIIHRLALLV